MRWQEGVEAIGCSEALDDNLASRLAAFDQRMRVLEIGRIDWRQPLGEGRAQLALIDELADPIQDPSLFREVRRLVDRTGEHQLVMDRHRLPLEGHDVEPGRVVDQAEAALRRYQLSD